MSLPILEEKVDKLSIQVTNLEAKLSYAEKVIIPSLHEIVRVGDKNNTDHINRVQRDLADAINKLRAEFENHKQQE